MDPRLIVAAQNGDVDELRCLMAGNPFLFIPAEFTGGENPLHIACMGGHLDFVKEILFYNPEFSKELNTVGMSPLHIASAYGHLDIVKELLKVGPHMCCVWAKNGKTALHYAVARGQIQIMEELISTSLDSIENVSDDEESCFHMAVKHNQVEALKRLILHVKSLSFTDAMLVLNWGNKQGNTILHLAAMRKQDEVIDHLLLAMKSYLELNVVNRQGLTALDILLTEPGRVKTMEDKLIEAGGKRAADSSTFLRGMFDLETHFHKLNVSSETRDAMLVVTVLIAAATFQAVVNPPGGVWQDTVVLGSNNTAYDHPSKVNSTQLPHVAGKSILDTLSPGGFDIFLFTNTIAFMLSCCLSTVLIKPPYRLVVWVALALMMTTYVMVALVVATRPIFVLFIILGSMSGVGILFVIIYRLPLIRINLYYRIRNRVSLIRDTP